VQKELSIFKKLWNHKRDKTFLMHFFICLAIYIFEPIYPYKNFPSKLTKKLKMMMSPMKSRVLPILAIFILAIASWRLTAMAESEVKV
jgi:hypothetical protein